MQKPQNDPDEPPEPEDPGDDGEGSSSGDAYGTFVLVAAFVLLTVLATIGGALGAFSFDPPPGTTTCSTTCMGVVRLECPGNRMMGLCFGIAVCDRPTHSCGIDPP